MARRLKEPAEMREGGTAIDGTVCGGAAMEDTGQKKKEEDAKMAARRRRRRPNEEDAKIVSVAKKTPAKRGG